ncbi:MAG: peptidylprolyl isomerase [Myxococcota bacterium]
MQRPLREFLGTIVAELYWQQAPRTVLNFYRLSGAGPWVNPRTGERMETPLYQKTLFHRVIPNFMIQGGDPLGSGMGGPGYSFADEFDGELRHDAPGILSMANAGPNTNGSQFFITEAPTPHLDGRHSVFGKVVDGLALVGRIARVERDARDMPLTKVVLEQVKIKRVAGGHF